MKPEELVLIDRQLELMLAIQFGGMNEGERRYLTKSMAAIRYQYEEAAKKRDAADVDEKTRKYYAGICESIAKGLPSITKGALSAASAFQKGDYINGCAAIMDSVPLPRLSLAAWLLPVVRPVHSSGHSSPSSRRAELAPHQRPTGPGQMARSPERVLPGVHEIRQRECHLQLLAGPQRGVRPAEGDSGRKHDKSFATSRTPERSSGVDQSRGGGAGLSRALETLQRESLGVDGRYRACGSIPWTVLPPR